MRNAEYIPVGQIPMVDLGAKYEAAKARREEAELRKLEYLSQFKKVRGQIAPGVLPELEKYWNEIQQSLDSGDMSFEAKKKRQQLLSAYQDIGANYLDWTKELDEREASILAEPEKFNNPAELIKQIDADRNRYIPADVIQSEISSLPKLGNFYRYKMREMSPVKAAEGLLASLKQGGGLSNVYDQKTGKINREALARTVNAYFDINQLTQEEEDQAIASVAQDLGVGIEQFGNLQNLSSDKRKEYLGMFGENLLNALNTLVANDITTEKEEDARQLALYRAKALIEKSVKDDGGTGPTFNVFSGSVPLVQVNKRDKKGTPISTGAGDAGFVFTFPIPGDKPSYVDPATNTKYTITNVGVGIDGTPQLVATRSLKLANKDTEVVSEVIPVTQQVLSSLSNVKQSQVIAAAIQQLNATYNQFIPGGIGTPAGQAGAMQLRGYSPATGNSALSPVGIPSNNGFTDPILAQTYKNLYGIDY